MLPALLNVRKDKPDYDSSLVWGSGGHNKMKILSMVSSEDTKDLFTKLQENQANLPIINLYWPCP